MENLRKPFQGVWNIVRFNWHFYLFSLGFLWLLLILNHYLAEPFLLLANLLFWAIVATSVISLLVSYYVYDLSGLYRLDWLSGLRVPDSAKIINVNAGFDETSQLLANRFSNANLNAFDFYDPHKHTEVSIKRARKAYPPYLGTQTISTSHLPLADHSVDCVFAILSAHEIRDANERKVFFTELGRCLKPSGEIIVTEHLRDLPNFLAYNLGFLHFHSRRSWLDTFSASGLTIKTELSITPFITSFILAKNGDPY
jgi:SAM-dependent methyltransferase